MSQRQQLLGSRKKSASISNEYVTFSIFRKDTDLISVHKFKVLNKSNCVQQIKESCKKAWLVKKKTIPLQM